MSCMKTIFIPELRRWTTWRGPYYNTLQSNFRKKKNWTNRQDGGDGIDGYDGLRFDYSESTMVVTVYIPGLPRKTPNFDTDLYNWLSRNFTVSRVNTVNMSIQSEIPIAWEPFNSGGSMRHFISKSFVLGAKSTLWPPARQNIDRSATARTVWDEQSTQNSPKRYRWYYRLIMGDRSKQDFWITPRAFVI